MSGVRGWVFLGRQANRPLVPWCTKKVPARLPLSGLAAGQGDVSQVEDWQWVSLRVENPVLQGQQVIAGEQQVQIPEREDAGKGKDV